MNATIIMIGTIVILYLIGYKTYASHIDKKVIQPDDNNKTPAYNQQDGVDFYPAARPVLFGHHFSSIAGAGPIIGPITAIAAFGWAAVLGWIIIGSIFIGAVHDYISLMVSERNKGASISEIARGCMSKKTGTVMAIFIWITLILVVTVFAVVGAKTLEAQPEMVIPTFGLILVAVLFGRLIYQYKMNLVTGTLLAIAANAALIIIGYKVPIKLPPSVLGLSPLNFWFLAILIYAGIASMLPVQVLLQPRDYISTFNLYACLILGIGAILTIRPELSAPAYISFNSSKGPMYPMLFILVACGAVSGFHSMVTGGTTSKQLDKESDGKPVGYGSMLLEGVLATMTLMLVAGGLYWTAKPGVDMNLLGFHQVLKSGGWIVVFGRGFGNLVHRMLPVLPLQLAAMIAMISLNTFIMTTADTATRISRFVAEEFLDEKMAPGFKRKIIALGLCIIPVLVIGFTNSWTTVWPVFGGANQLIAGLTLFVVSSYLLAKKKPTLYTLIPGIFMMVTTVAALLWQGYTFIFAKKPANYLLGFVCIGLIVLAVFVAAEAYRIFSGKKADPGEKPPVETAMATE